MPVIYFTYVAAKLAKAREDWDRDHDQQLLVKKDGDLSFAALVSDVSLAPTRSNDLSDTQLPASVAANVLRAANTAKKSSMNASKAKGHASKSTENPLHASVGDLVTIEPDTVGGAVKQSNTGKSKKSAAATTATATAAALGLEMITAGDGPMDGDVESVDASDNKSKKKSKKR